ncbi:MAG: ParB/RepB/Spo0J family partition protein [Hespellia sp.]|nr:ParB/RepB/Spo0J family partition protein [Hespellia sp.]
MAPRRNGLGKGIDSLIPPTPKKRTETEKTVVKTAPKEETTANTEKKEEAVINGEQKVKITLVEPNREQPRKDFDEDSLLELADSIKQYGVLQPLLVTKKDDYYEIIAGERRWRAAKLAGVKEVPVIIKDYTNQEIVEISLIENIQRENLNPIEEAMAYKRLLEEFSLKQDEVAERVSKSRTAVTNSMRLLKLGDRIQQMIVDDMISTGHARALLAIDDDEQRFILANKIFDEKLSVRETEKLIKSIKNPKKQAAKPKQETDQFIYDNLIEKMKGAIGTKVNIAPKTKGKGKIEIEYYSEEELERIFDLIMSTQEA